MKNARLDRRVAAEFIGTFGIVLAGAGAIVINDSRQGVITHVGVAATFGLSQRSEAAGISSTESAAARAGRCASVSCQRVSAM